MNVNPFSYLIEKLKGYVSKSGDTMTGQLRINNNSDTPLIIKKANTSIGKVYLGFENSAETIGYFSVGADKKPYFTSGNGADTQIALTSDITTVTKGSATFDITVASGGFVKYVQVNKVVFVTLGFTVSDNSIYNATICHDLPIPELPTGVVTFVTVADEADGTMARLKLDYNSTSGYLQNYYGKQVVNGHAYISSFCYIAK